MLEKELAIKKPRTVLLGSTTECFQPVEKEFQLTRKLLEILNKNKVSYVILTRSPCIADYISLLNQGFCRKIYFTVNNFNHSFKQALDIEIEKQAKKARKEYKIYKHSLGEFFKNSYLQ